MLWMMAPPQVLMHVPPNLENDTCLDISESAAPAMLSHNLVLRHPNGKYGEYARSAFSLKPGK